MKCNNQKVSEINLKESLKYSFNRDEEIKTENDLTYEAEYAIQLLKKQQKGAQMADMPYNRCSRKIVCL